MTSKSLKRAAIGSLIAIAVLAVGHAIMYVRYSLEVAELNELLKGANQT